MTTMTLDVPDEVAYRVAPLREHLPALMEHVSETLPIGYPSGALYLSSDYPIVDEMMGFLASGPTPNQILEHKVSAELQERLETLLDKNREAVLVEKEAAELDAFRRVNHTMILLKARVRKEMSQASA